MNNRHIPVLPKETIESLNLAAGKNVIDCTVGDAGHSQLILEKTSPDGKLLALDADPESLLRAKNFLYDYQDRITFVRSNFENLKEVVEKENFGPVHGILLDLGWSTQQFEERKRGFSFQNMDEKLDMRYDTQMDCEHIAETPTYIDGKPVYGKCTAAEWVNMKDEDELASIFKKYGEEKLSREIAKAIIEKRKDFYLETVGDLVDVILDSYRKKLKTDKDIPWVGGIHPATKVFQALRIVVNDELGALERVLPQAIKILEPGGRLAVISFHSLEDRIVKHFFKSQNEKTLRIITKKPIVASGEEIANNPRARSAKLRVIEKINS